MEAERISVQEASQNKSKESNQYSEKLKSESVVGGRKNIIKKGRSKVINPCVDWGFKYLFGKEESKSNLIGFLNLTSRDVD